MDHEPADVDGVAELYRLYRLTMERAAERAAEEEAALADVETWLWRWFPEIAAQKAMERAEGQVPAEGR